LASILFLQIRKKGKGKTLLPPSLLRGGEGERPKLSHHLKGKQSKRKEGGLSQPFEKEREKKKKGRYRWFGGEKACPEKKKDRSPYNLFREKGRRRAHFFRPP